MPQHILGLSVSELGRLWLVATFQRRGFEGHVRRLCAVAIPRSVCEAVLPNGGESRGKDGREALECGCRVVGGLSNVEWTSPCAFLSSWASGYANMRKL